MKIAVFVGSLRKDSYNKKLAQNVEALLPEAIEFEYVDFSDVPLFNQDMENDYPDSAQRVKTAVESADAVLFVTPEYNRGIPGPLKNIIDWLSRPHGRNSFDGKPAAVIGASGGMLGTALSQTQLRSVLLYLNTHLLGQPEVYVTHAPETFDENDQVNETTKQKLREFLDQFITHVNRNQ